MSMLGRAHFSAAAMHKLSTAEVIAKLLNEKHVDWHALPERYKYGSYIKKQRFVKAVEIPGDKIIDAVRSKPVAISIDINKFTPEFEHFLISKYAPDAAFDAAGN